MEQHAKIKITTIRESWCFIEGMKNRESLNKKGKFKLPVDRAIKASQQQKSLAKRRNHPHKNDGVLGRPLGQLSIEREFRIIQKCWEQGGTAPTDVVVDRRTI